MKHEIEMYDHYVAVDWAKDNMAIARMTAKLNKITVLESPSDIGNLKAYLSQLQGSIVLTVEETTTAQWLYTELKNVVARLVICDPYRNRLLSEGPKTDKIDATKLVQLLKANLLKEVYHTADEFLYLRRIVSGYEDLVKAGVRLQNQRYSLLMASGTKSTRGATLENPMEQFVLARLDRQIETYNQNKKEYESQFRIIGKKHKQILNLRTLPGIDWINAAKIVSQVVTPFRFSSKGDYLCYCGLVKLDRISGGRSYGKKSPRYSRVLKEVYKMAAWSSILHDGPLNDYYNQLITEKNYPEHQARHVLARRLAILSLGILRNGTKFDPKKRGADNELKSQ